MTWLLVAFGIVAAGYAAWMGWCGWRARRWPVAPGYVVAFAFPEVRRKGGQSIRTFEVRYRYEVGRTFDGRRIGLGAQQVLPPPGVRPGDPVPVYHDPRDPGKAVLRPEVPVTDVVLGVIGAALAFGEAVSRR